MAIKVTAIRAAAALVAAAKAKGVPIPRRASMVEIYSAPAEGAEVFDISKGE